MDSLVNHDPRSSRPDPESLFTGAGEMGAIMRAVNWAPTAFGPVAQWPQSLQTTMSICLTSRFPIAVYWGPEFLMLYNQSLVPMVGASKHPGALGQPARIVLAEIWQIIEPLLTHVRTTGEATWSEDLMLPLARTGEPEESYFTFTYSPIRDETQGVGGVFCAVVETTDKVIEGRRLLLFNALAADARATTPAEACVRAAAEIAGAPGDVPFALLYLLDAAGVATLAGAANLAAGGLLSPPCIAAHDASPWPFTQLEDEPIYVQPPRAIPGSRGAVILPIQQSTGGQRFGFIVAGLSPLLSQSPSYTRFHKLLAASISQTVSGAAAYENERKRAEALAEIDRAKTAFFANVSHEFRTPLTLILGPTEDVLAGVHGVLTAAAHDQIATVQRNALRLLKLVNTLLEFARSEAGRIEASYAPTDLAQLTGELASVFRSAIERAGVALRVDCEPLPEPVYVDREMWEKIVLNLVSNAFKFTFDGEIAVSLRVVDDRVELQVRDTGSGISTEHLPDLFKRFHRVQATRSRSYEGSGIGLALVHDLVGLHGGVASVASTIGVGSTFTVSVPRGKAHLPAERIDAATASSQSVQGAEFLAEAMRWLPTSERGAAPSASGQSSAQRSAYTILVADDNADLRGYVAGLLSPRYTVETVADGQSALEAALRRPPDLILSDVMMPRLDGLGLLREIRGHEATRTVPVILLSARAGEDATVEGLEAGADDYLQKPFSARELLARVRTQLEMAKIRRESAQQQQVENELRTGMKMRDDFLSLASHEFMTPLTTLGLQVDGLLRSLQEGPDSAKPLVQRAEKVRHQANRLEQLIGSMLDVFGLTESSKLALHPEETELGVVARAVVETFRQESKQASAQLNLRAENVTGRWDRTRLEQVLGRLIENALKFGAAKPIDIAIDGTPEEAVIQVCDRGIGIATKDQERIFDRFERAVSQDEYGGFGLGLWIVRGLVQAMRGSVSVESQPGAGATFTVRLPRWP